MSMKDLLVGILILLMQRGILSSLLVLVFRFSRRLKSFQLSDSQMYVTAKYYKIVVFVTGFRDLEASRYSCPLLLFD